jgi:3-hydroxyacyl-[acyl-carrier-protein] dehydratase
MLTSQVVEHVDIRQLLPHRYPFLLLDRITDYEPHKWARGIRNVAEREPLLLPEGSEWVPPGVVIEAIGQLGIALSSLSREPGNLANIVLGSLAGVQIGKRVPLGCQIQLEVEITKQLQRGAVFRGYARVNGLLAISIDSIVTMEY